WGAHSPARTGRSRGRRRACRGGRRSFVLVAAARRRGERRSRAARTRPWPWPGRSRSTGSGRHLRRRAGAPGAPPAPPHGASVGQPKPGSAMMEDRLVVVGVGERGILQRFDKVVALNGRVLTSAAELTAEVQRHPPGTVLHYLVARGHQLMEIDVATRTVTLQWFRRFIVEALIPGLLFLVLGGVVMFLKPGAGESRVFFAVCLLPSASTILYPH